MKELALHILDIAQNSIRAGARDIRITLSEQLFSDWLEIIIADNGCGMDELTLEKAADPYYTSRTTRKVGLGLSLLKMNAELAGGTMTIKSEKGIGTTVTATFRYSHVDRPPMGDLSGTVALLISGNPSINFIYEHILNANRWTISTSEIKEVLGESSVSDIHIVRHLKELIDENIADLK